MNILKTKAQFDNLPAVDKETILNFLWGEFTEDNVMISLEDNGVLRTVNDLTDYELDEHIISKQNWIDKDLLLYILTGLSTLNPQLQAQ
jgi:hypothetical protein